MASSDTERKAAKIGLAKIGANHVLTPKESLTWRTCDDLGAILKSIGARNKTGVVLDCKSMPFVDSKALELLLHWHEEINARGGVLKIVGLNGVCRDILMSRG